MSEPFIWPVRVYWEDTDGGGIVYFANYLKFMERARTEWLRSFGLDQGRLAEESGLIFAIVSVNIEYKLPARLDDQLLVTCESWAEGRASFAFRQEIYRGSLAGELLSSGETRAACLEQATLRPRRLPQHLLDRLKDKPSSTVKP